MIKYSDGSGNQYLINRESIEYNPVKPQFSSSGFYNGGEHVKKGITRQQYEKIKSLLTEIMANEVNHIKNRVKGSGLITLEEGNISKSCILRPVSVQLNEIERVLKEII